MVIKERQVESQIGILYKVLIKNEDYFRIDYTHGMDDSVELRLWVIPKHASVYSTLITVGGTNADIETLATRMMEKYKYHLSIQEASKIKENRNE